MGGAYIALWEGRIELYWRGVYSFVGGEYIALSEGGIELRAGFQARSKDQEILEEGGGAGLSKLDVFCFELSKLFINSGAMDIVLVTLSSTAVERAIAQCISRWAVARGHRLNTSIVLAAVYGLSGLFRAVSAVDPITLSPSHSVPVPNRSSRLRGR